MLVHQCQLVTLDHLWGASTVDEHAADHQVGVGEAFLDREGRREDGRGTPAERNVELSQAVDVGVIDEHVGFHADRDEGGVHADRPATDDHHVGRAHAGHPAEQDAAPAERLLEHEGARLGGDLAGDLAHRRQQRQPAPRVLDRLVGDAGGARRTEAPGQVRGRRQVQEREQGGLGPKQRDLLPLGLLHLQDQVGIAEHVLGGRNDARSLGLVVRVRDRAALPGPTLNQDLVTVLGELARPDRRQRDAVLVGLDLGGDADLQARTSSLVVSSNRQPRCSSSANISAGSMQRSGASTPRASIRPLASSRTAAAAGAAVETTPPPRPHASIDSVTARTRTDRPPPDASTRCTETVLPEGGTASPARRWISPSGASPSSRSVARRSGDSESLKLASLQPKLSWKVRSSECRVWIVSPAPIGSPNSTTPPGESGSISSARPSRSTTGGRVSSSSRVWSAYGTLKPGGGSRSRPAADTWIESAGAGSASVASSAIRLVLPGAEPMPSRASRPARSKRGPSSSWRPVIQYSPPRSR